MLSFLSEPVLFSYYSHIMFCKININSSMFYILYYYTISFFLLQTFVLNLMLMLTFGFFVIVFFKYISNLWLKIVSTPNLFFRF